MIFFINPNYYHPTMKNYFVILFLSTFAISTAQSKILFSYDTAGNQIKRELCISGCVTSKKVNDSVKDIESLVQGDLLKFASEDTFSYYPNPVKEELYLKWKISDENNIQNIQVYNISGQVLTSFKKGKSGDDNQNISFSNYPIGIYMINLVYKNGDEKTIKIIKQ
ncbi:T9SS type A sorting domain-containing protein [Flavobacterium sp. N1736]|uniref:T9SS type A sorting domain-containing protein n=1 Tax=Flavobacterium sp. N1736 TaxID=2986823 RepID=UPI00222501A1|nr:T9SS type A sorting domain-containing protein [Flavobacterium sp. N1736]